MNEFNAPASQADVMRLEALIIYLQSQIEILRAVVVEIGKTDHRSGKQIQDFLDDQLQKRVQYHLAALSDRDPALATELAKILQDAKST